MCTDSEVLIDELERHLRLALAAFTLGNPRLTARDASVALLRLALEETRGPNPNAPSSGRGPRVRGNPLFRQESRVGVTPENADAEAVASCEGCQRAER